MGEADKIPVTGKVIWITPQNAQGNRVPSIGVQFLQDDQGGQAKIVTYLAGSLGSDRATHIMICLFNWFGLR